jgi:hypothetical protein
MSKQDPCAQYATYRELRDAMEEAVQLKGRTREQRRRMRKALREELAEGIASAIERSRRLPRGQRPRCGAKTRRGTSCVRPALENGRCPNHGGLSTGPRTKAGRNRIAAAQRRRWAEWRADQQ